MKQTNKVMEIIPEVLLAMDELRNELITISLRMEKALRTNDCNALRTQVKKIRELVR